MTKIVALCPDEIGGHLEPEPIDWKVLSDPTSSMSRLQRDVWLRKQAKAKRRAA